MNWRTGERLYVLAIDFVAIVTWRRAEQCSRVLCASTDSLYMKILTDILDESAMSAISYSESTWFEAYIHCEPSANGYDGEKAAHSLDTSI